MGVGQAWLKGEGFCLLEASIRAKKDSSILLRRVSSVSPFGPLYDLDNYDYIIEYG